MASSAVTPKEKQTTDHFSWMIFNHEWEAVAVNNHFEPFLDPLTRQLRTDCGRHKTDVLYRCACGKVKTKKLNGNWTLEQIRREVPDVQP